MNELVWHLGWVLYLTVWFGALPWWPDMDGDLRI